MIVIGLTGSLAMGKSTVAHMLRHLHIPVFDADDSVHELLQKDQSIIAAIQKFYPPAVHNNKVDRKILGDYVFVHPKELAKLEAILHPKVREVQQQFIAEMRRLDHRLIALDIPLLFESQGDYQVDKTILVTTDPDTQKQRAFERPGMTEERFQAIRQRQMPEDEKRRRADYCLDSTGPKDLTFQKLQKILDHILEEKNAETRDHS